MKQRGLALLLGVLWACSLLGADLREDTATQVAIGPFLDGGDGVTAETSLTVTDWDCDLIKHANSGMTNTALTITASGGSNDAAHVTSGMYSLELTATDTNTAGRLVLICDHATPTTFMPVRHEWEVKDTQTWDSDHGADNRKVEVVEWNGVTLATTNPLPNAVPGATGGLFIAGTNAATTISTSLTLGSLVNNGVWTQTGNMALAAGLNITQSSSNTPALVVTGNGTGNGATFTSGSGATGNGIAVTAASTNGNGFSLTGTGTGAGLLATPGATGHGFNLLGGATSGSGLRMAGTAGNSPAATFVGQGSAAGLLATGGATGHGASFVGGATSGNGLNAAAATSGIGINATGVGTTQAGLAATGGSTSSSGALFTGGGTGSGLRAVSGAGATGDGIAAVAASTNGNGIGTTATGTGSGLSATPSTTFVNPILLGQGIPAPTTIATLASQTSFTLTAGSADDNAYNGYGIIVRDVSTAAQQALGCVRDYTGSTRTVALLEDPAIFTMATTDNVQLLPAYCDAQVVADLLETAMLICTVDTANFAGDSNDFACDLTDRAGAAVTSNLADGDLAGLEVVVITGAQQYEKRFVSATTDWDGANNEMRLNLSRDLPATLADGVTVIIR